MQAFMINDTKRGAEVRFRDVTEATLNFDRLRTKTGGWNRNDDLHTKNSFSRY